MIVQVTQQTGRSKQQFVVVSRVKIRKATTGVTETSTWFNNKIIVLVANWQTILRNCFESTPTMVQLHNPTAECMGTFICFDSGFGVEPPGRSTIFERLNMYCVFHNAQHGILSHRDFPLPSVHLRFALASGIPGLVKAQFTSVATVNRKNNAHSTWDFINCFCYCPTCNDTK
jgi:hypothetical protein